MNTPTTLRELFEAALALAPAERPAFLHDHCSDAGMRGQIDAMLHADESTEEPVSGERFARLAQAIGDDEPLAALPAGTRIGPFEIVRVIGEGGSSTVFEARREFEGATQRVALKLLRQNLLSPDARRRFGREQRALVRLQHPHIARMIEGGVTGHGLAYIALELIDGTPITQHAQDRALDVRERLRLFADICRAVEAAHRALIVHRDIKPSNVLVTADGEPKLLDFGVAKLLVDEIDSGATLLPAFTPAYAAPEQADGGAITTATDVYALGIVLAELLGGTRAAAGGRTPSAPARRVTGPAGPAHPPTTRRLRGDLDAIIEKATESDPERRYASAGMLADEIDCLLDGRPVKAQPQTRWYRARKFVTRHRGGVASTVAFLLAIFAALGVALWQANVARGEAARAHAENRFIAGLFDPLRTGVQEGEMPTARQLLDAGAAQLNSQFAGNDAALADLALLFSRVYIEIGAPDVALELAGRARLHARAAWGERDPRAWTALARHGEAAYHLDRYADAAGDLEQAVAGMRAAGSRGDDYAFALGDLGLVYAKTGRSAEAVAAQQASYDVLVNSGDRIELATVMNNLGGAYLAAGDAERALQWRQRAYDWHVAHGLGGNRAALVVLGNIARVKFGLGRWREALADLDRLLPLRDQVAGGSLKRWSFSAQACSTASLLWQLEKAQAYCERALVEAGQGTASVRSRAIVLGYRGALRIHQGYYAQARADLAESNRLLATVEGDNADVLYGNALDMAEMVRVEGTPGDYVATLAPMLSSSQNPNRHAISSLLLARLALACAEVDSVPDGCRDDVAVRAESLVAGLRPDHPYRLPAVTALALRAVRLGDAPGAAARLRSDLAAGQSALGADHPWVGEAQAALAVAADAMGDRRLVGEARGESERIARMLPSQHPLRQRLLRAD